MENNRPPIKLNIPDELMRQEAEKLRLQADAEYREFEDYYSENKCYLCKQSYNYFNDNKPCIHWLLQPFGFRKKHLNLVFAKYGMFQIMPYLRWLATAERAFGNINNLSEEQDAPLVVGITIRYKNFEWSLVCSESDLAGHQTTKHGYMPHYHLQMRVDDREFVNYSDFHIPLTNYDLFNMDLVQGKIEGMGYGAIHGAGMQEVLELVPPEQLLEGMKVAKEDSQGTFKLDTIISAEDGHMISGDDIAELIKEHQETGEPMANLVKRLPHVKVQTIIQPGPGVPEFANRQGGRKKRNKSS